MLVIDYSLIFDNHIGDNQPDNILYNNVLFSFDSYCWRIEYGIELFLFKVVEIEFEGIFINKLWIDFHGPQRL